MKKRFKTIMSLTAALAISMSGMSMTSAAEDPTPPTTRSVTAEDKNGDGKFDDVDSIPVTFGAEHLLNFTIDFGDMAISYDFTSEGNNYGWGQSFNGTNNKLTITNNSTCPVRTTTHLNIDTDTYQFLSAFDFKFYYDTYNAGTQYSTDSGTILTYPGDPAMGTANPYYKTTSKDYYLTAQNKNPTDMHNYQFNNAKIGQFTITLEPLMKAEA